MTQTTFQVILSTDGKHTVIFTTDDMSMTENGQAWARSTYDRLVELYGLKNEQRQKPAEEASKEEAPICEVHNLPMVRQAGKHGAFWSCHQRNEDGSFCSYKPNGRQP